MSHPAKTPAPHVIDISRTVAESLWQRGVFPELDPKNARSICKRTGAARFEVPRQLLAEVLVFSRSLRLLPDASRGEKIAWRALGTQASQCLRLSGRNYLHDTDLMVRPETGAGWDESARTVANRLRALGIPAVRAAA